MRVTSPTAYQTDKSKIREIVSVDTSCEPLASTATTTHTGYRPESPHILQSPEQCENALLKEQLLQLIKDKSLKKGDFTLASGEGSDYFFDMKRTMLDPDGISMLATAFMECIADEEATHIGGVAMGAVPVVSAMCLQSRSTHRPLRAFFVRKIAKDHGMRKQIEGYIPEKGEPVLLFEDVTTTGGSAMVAVEALRQAGRQVDTLYTVVDRLEGATTNLEKHGIRLVPLFTKNDFTS